jgi:hypothetical protein
MGLSGRLTGLPESPMVLGVALASHPAPLAVVAAPTNQNHHRDHRGREGTRRSAHLRTNARLGHFPKPTGCLLTDSGSRRPGSIVSEPLGHCAILDVEELRESESGPLTQTSGEGGSLGAWGECLPRLEAWIKVWSKSSLAPP